MVYPKFSFFWDLEIEFVTPAMAAIGYGGDYIFTHVELSEDKVNSSLHTHLFVELL